MTTLDELAILTELSVAFGDDPLPTVTDDDPYFWVSDGDPVISSSALHHTSARALVTRTGDYGCYSPLGDPETEGWTTFRFSTLSELARIIAADFKKWRNRDRS
jgi:hypothetical protein